MVRATTIAIALALVLAGAAASKTAPKVVARGHTLTDGHGRIALAEVNAIKPASLTARVVAKPRQSVKLDWSVVCVKVPGTDVQGYNATATPKIGTTKITAPGSLKLTMPLAHPVSCEVAVYSTLSKGGKQTLELVQT